MEKGKKNADKKPVMQYSREAFETAFYARLEQTPEEFIRTKLAVGSDFQSVHYLYDIIAAGIAQGAHCTAYPFEDYYPPKHKEPTSMKKTIVYNKLVRDKIPEIIEASGKKCSVETMGDEKYLEMLDAKLQEELDEYQQSKSLEELADLLEVMGAVVHARGYTWDQFTTLRKEKKEKRGGFNQKLLLKEVIED